jgi:hypothetical protein
MIFWGAVVAIVSAIAVATPKIIRALKKKGSEKDGKEQ